ncbi:MAG: 3-phosphoshikimate 1-carboxyvinyltransferase [Pyrinomonadaceae bacterium]
MIIKPVKLIQGQLQLPGDKSISHRAAMIAALARGTSRLRDFSPSEDCAATLSCLQQLGVTVIHDHQVVVIKSTGTLKAPSESLDCGNSGSTMRLLAGMLAGQAFTATLTGDESLRTRPMGRIMEPLKMMGAGVESEAALAPLIITGRSPLAAIRYELPVASAQVKSCILLAALNAEGRTEVVEKKPTRDHTERMLQWFGVPLHITSASDSSAARIAIEGPAQFDARDVCIPGDISSAAFFIAAAVLLSGSNLVMENVGLNPSRSQFLAVLRSLGADIEIGNIRDEYNEPVGTVQVRSGLVPASNSEARHLSGAMIPALIDELPLLAVLGTQIEGGIEIHDAGELRVKETDRIAATVANLRAMGAKVEEYDDGLKVGGPIRLHGATVDSRGDHRIAMAFAVAALIAEGETEIQDADCVAVSFPGFFDLLNSAVKR